MAKKTVKAVTRKQKYLAAIAGDTTAPEPVTNEEKLLYNIADRTSNDQFIVKLTPTSETGGTMDKSNAEILAAYMQGKRIMFDITVDAAACRVQATLAAAFEGYQYPSFNAYGIDTSGTTIINLYVDPSDEESYAFTMDAVEIGGGGEQEPLYINLSYSEGIFTGDKTGGEIVEAIKSHRQIIVKDNYGICYNVNQYSASTHGGSTLYYGATAIGANPGSDTSIDIIRWDIGGGSMTEGATSIASVARRIVNIS